MMNPNTNTNLRKNKMAANEKIKAILEISWGHNFTWPRIYNLKGMRLSFVLYFRLNNSLFTINIV